SFAAGSRRDGVALSQSSLCSPFLDCVQRIQLMAVLKDRCIFRCILACVVCFGFVLQSALADEDASRPVEYEWTNVTMKAAFVPRDGAGAITYKGRMWFLGGWNPA